MSLDPIPIWNALCRSRFRCRRACRPPRARRESRRGPAAVAVPKSSAKPNEPPPQGDPYVTLLLEYSPPWLVSMVFHMLVLIVMGLIIFSQAAHRPVQLDAEAASTDKADEPLDSDAPMGLPEGSPDGEGAVMATPDWKPVDDPLASPGKHAIRPGGHAATSDIEAPGIAWARRGTNGAVRKERAKLGNGISDGTQLAVARGLEWLARNQQHDGSWSLAGPFSDGVLQGMGQSGGRNRHGALGVSGRRQHALGRQVQEKRRQRLGGGC